MIFLEYAKKMELNDVRFYQEEAAWTSHIELRRVLQLLSNEEEKHYNFLVALERSPETAIMPSFPAKKAENIFCQLRKAKRRSDSSNEEAVIYKRALEIEKESEKFYRNWAKEIEQENLKEQVIKLVNEEQKHVSFVNELAEYMMKCRSVSK